MAYKLTNYKELKKLIWMLAFVKGVNLANIQRVYSTETSWLNFLLGGIDNSIDGAPGFPDEKIQKIYVGSSYEHSLREAFKFYLLLKGSASELGISITKKTKILDFGCGWGRITRFFYKDFARNNILGVDVEPDIIDICKKTMLHDNFLVIDKEPPLALADNSFDIISSYSVFSHLAESIANDWIEEFARILKPGGIVVATSHSKRLIDYCANLRRNPAERKSDWHNALATCFPDPEKTKRAYKDGKFIHAATGGGGLKENTFYGETILSEKYVKKNFTTNLNFIDYFDDSSKLPQALMVLQKG